MNEHTIPAQSNREEIGGLSFYYCHHVLLIFRTTTNARGAAAQLSRVLSQQKRQRAHTNSHFTLSNSLIILLLVASLSLFFSLNWIETG